MEIPADLLYTDEHEWIRVEGEEGTVGVTAFAEDQLGDVVYVELPEPGTQVTRGQAFGVIESVKAVYDLFAPATGEVVARNEALLDAPEKVNQSPYGDGWMIRVRLSQPGELDALMKPADYEAFATSER
jgi:glycine cleavage system H protein